MRNPTRLLLIAIPVLLLAGCDDRTTSKRNTLDSRTPGEQSTPSEQLVPAARHEPPANR
jgi:alpha-beta hydrolase superfamily lysophospholipase